MFKLDNKSNLIGILNKKKKYVLYMFLVGCSALLSFSKFVLFANILGPSSFGTYSLVLTSYIFILYIGSLGLNEAVLKLGGVSFSKNNGAEFMRMRDLALFFGSLSLIIVSLIGYIVSMLLLEDQLIAVFLFSGLMAIVAFQFNILDSYFRSQQKIIVFSAMLFFKSCLLLVMGVFGAELYGVNGVLLSELASFLIVFVLFLYYSGWGGIPRLAGAWRDFKTLVSNGFLMLSSMFLRMLAVLMDRWAISMTLGVSSVGKYSFLMIFFQLGIILLALLTNVLGPRWLANYGKTGDADTLITSINSRCRMILLVATVLAVPLYLIFPYVMELNFPEYYDEDFIYSATCIYLGVTILCCTYLYDWLFIAVSREKLLTRISVVVLLSSFLGILVVWPEPSLLKFTLLFLFIRCLTAGMYIFVIKNVLSDLRYSQALR